MIDRRMNLLILGIPAFLLCAATPAPSKPAVKAVSTSPAALTLQVSAGKSVYALYEPVVLTYAVRNPTDAEIRSGLRMHYGQGVAISIRLGEGEAKPYQSGPAICTVPTSDAVFQPRSTDSGEVVAFFSDLAGDLAFPAPGRYTLVATAHVWNDPAPVLVKSEALSIEVREPADLDARAMEALGSKDRLVALFRSGVKGFCGDEVNDTCGERLRSFLRRYTESDYAPAVTYYYGMAVASGALPIGPQDEKASDVFAGFLRRWPGHPFEPSVMAAMILELHGTGRREESLEWLHRFEKKFPDRASQLRQLRAGVE